QAQLGGERFQVVALSVDQQGVPIARKFFSEVGIKTLPLYVDPSAKAAFTVDAAGLPATLLVDRAGREIGRHLGAVKWDSPEVLARLRRAISAEETPAMTIYMPTAARMAKELPMTDAERQARVERAACERIFD